MPRPLVALTAAVIALGTIAAFAAPVPKDTKGKDMTAPFDFPPVDAKEWKDAGNGLKVWDVKVGDGKEVPAGATVTVHYVGWLASNGKKFDSSKDRGETISFGLHQVIKGWTEGVPGMKPGGIRRLLIPAAMGYGARGAGAAIPPNSDLVFVIELISSK